MGPKAEAISLKLQPDFLTAPTNQHVWETNLDTNDLFNAKAKRLVGCTENCQEFLLVTWFSSKQGDFAASSFNFACRVKDEPELFR